MKKPKLAVIDGDILAYKASFWADVEGIDCLEDRLAVDLENWTPEGVTKTIVALSCPRSKNFRRDIWPRYKAHRDGTAQPDSLDYAIEILYDNADTRCIDKLEADDLMGLASSKGAAISVTIDKDLRSVPGWHWNPDKEEDSVFITEEEADKFFFKQWIMGDSTDGIPGLWRVGPKKAEKFLNSWAKESWVDEIFNLYENEDRPNQSDYGDMTRKEFALSMARCVRILREGEYTKSTRSINLWEPNNWVKEIQP